MTLPNSEWLELICPKTIRKLKGNQGELRNTIHKLIDIAILYQETNKNTQQSKEKKARRGFLVEMDDLTWLAFLLAIANSTLFNLSEIISVESPESDEPSNEEPRVAAHADDELPQSSTPNPYFYLPNLFTRCAVVGMGHKSKNTPIWTPEKPLVIDAISGAKRGAISLSYSGEKLRVQEIETWSQIFGLIKENTNEGLRRLTIQTPYLLRCLSRPITAQNNRLLHKQLQCLATARLAVNRLEVHENSTPLLLLHHQTANEITVEIPNETHKLFEVIGSSWFNHQEYFSLKSPSVRRLYLLYKSHPDCWPLTILELRKYLGDSRKDLKRFQTLMDKAHEALLNANIIKSWHYTPVAKRYNQPCYVVERH